MSISDIIEGVKNLEEALKCEVCKHLLNDPLLVAKCGHSICRECFAVNFSSKCPICNIPVNTKDSLEDKLLKELLSHLKKFKQVLESGSFDQTVASEEREHVTVNPQAVASVSNASGNDYTIGTCDQESPKKTSEEVNFCPSVNFSCSTPIVRRKKRVFPRNRPGRPSSSDESIIKGTPGSGSKTKLIANSIKKRRAASISRSRNSSKDSSLSLNTSTPLSVSSLNKKNHKGETLLHRAVIKGDIEKVKELIEEGASVNTVDNNGWTPLHEASNHGFVEIAKLLLDKGALVNVPSQKDNITPLHDALINDQIQIGVLLVSRGADMHAKTALGYTALDLCKTDEDRAALIEACSPFICANIPASDKKNNSGDNYKMIVLHSNLTDKQKEHLEKCAKLLKADIVDNFVPEVTHIITSCDNNGNCTRTMKILLGMLTGKWIISFQWVEVCLEYKQRIEEEVFEVQGTKNHPNTQAAKESRKNAAQKFPPLFDGFYFYLHGPFHKPTPEREELCKLIHLGGGKILSREPREDTIASENYRLPYHAPGTPVEGVSHIILYQDKPPRDHHFRSGHISTTHVMWLIECISEFKLKEFQNGTQNNK